ncbi:unnamed protein product, partial [Meganyctiphanes norvegica]
QESQSDQQSEDTLELQPNNPEQGITAQVQHSTSIQERMLDGKKVLTSFGPINRTLSRAGKPKGPAPPPPVKIRPSLDSLTQENTQKEDKKEECKDTNNFTEKLPNTEYSSTETLTIEDSHLSENSSIENQHHMETQAVKDIRSGVLRRTSTIERHISLPVIEENIKNTRKRPAPQPRNSSDKETSPSKDITKSNRPPDIVKPPRSSLIQKPPRLADKNITIERRPSIPKKPDIKTVQTDNEVNLRRLEEVLSNILDHGSPAPLRATKSDENIMESLSVAETKKPKGILKKVSLKPSKYEVAHREALEDSKALLEQLPRGELQRNKIVLRVPSFRTAGCQTESYRPIRRRASCAQTNLSVATRYRDANRDNTTTTSSLTKNKGTTKSSSTQHWPPRVIMRESNQESSVLETSSSSSGYSSPEAHATPTNSGPPSPASSSVVVSDEDHQDEVQMSDGTNVTVIEVNKDGSRTTKSNTIPWKPLHTIVPPPRPPKPLRLRHMSDAAAFIGARGGLLLPVHHRNHQLPHYEDVFGLAALTENVMLLTEAINPVLVHNTIRPQSSIEETHEELGLPRSTTPRVVDMIRKASANLSMNDTVTAHRPQPRPALRTHSLSLPRPSLIPPTPTRRYSKDSRSPSPTHSSSNDHQQHNIYSDQYNDPHNNHTAAYLASLELLASHYRHQALANAKQLQLQQRLLAQQQKQQQQQSQQQDKGSEKIESDDTEKEAGLLNQVLKKETHNDIQQKQYEQPPISAGKTIESEC